MNNDIFHIAALAPLHLELLLFLAGMGLFVYISWNNLLRKIWKKTIKRNMKMSRRMKIAEATGLCQCKSCRQGRKATAKRRLKEIRFIGEPSDEAIYI
jgi:hypothetical protein